MNEPTTGPEGRTQEQIDLAVQTFAHIEAHPEEWDQASWRCETGMCFAGHAAILAGAKWVFPKDRGVSTIALPADHPLVGLNGVGWTGVSAFARWALGLEYEETIALFAADNNLEDLRRMVTAIQNREPFDE